MSEVDLTAESSAPLPADPVFEMHWLFPSRPVSESKEPLFELQFGQMMLSLSNTGLMDLLVEHEGGRVKADCNLPYCKPGEQFNQAHKLVIRTGTTSLGDRCLILANGNRTVVSIIHQDANRPVISPGPVSLSFRRDVRVAWILKFPDGVETRLVGFTSEQLFKF